MSDFREKFYIKYSTTFKVHISKFDDKNVGYTLSKYKKQYLPILNDFKKNSKILELGCGRGIFLNFLKENGYDDVLGVDISEEQIEIAKKNNFQTKLGGVIEFLKTNEKKFDLIFAIDLIEHFSKTELIELFERIYKCLNKNGAFIFHTPNGLGINANGIIYGDLTHLTIFTPNSATQLLKLVGFDKIIFFETGPYAKNINGTFRLILWKIIKLRLNLIRFIETGGTEKVLTQNFIGYSIK